MVSCGISDNDIEVANVVLTGNSARKHILGVINVARGDAAAEIRRRLKDEAVAKQPQHGVHSEVQDSEIPAVPI